jgi:conjugative transfer signal peptidase TraF
MPRAEQQTSIVGGAPERKPRRSRSGRLGWGGIAVAASGGALITLFCKPRSVLLWNASPSSIIGLYVVGTARGVRTGDVVVAWAPPGARRTAATRDYLPLNVPLVKHAAAVAGDRVCATGNRILINGRLAAVRRARDPSGRMMPSWSGCARLKRGELFLLSPGAPLAFDGRYFGVTRAAQVIGKAQLIWTNPVRGRAHG